MNERLPTYRRGVQVQGVPAPDTQNGAENLAGRMRQTFSALANRVGQMADRAAASEGERDGLVAGLDPYFRPGRRNTIYGQAYDRAGTRAWLDGQENALSARIEELATQFEADPEGLAAAILDLEKQTADGLAGRDFPEANVAFAGFFSRQRTSRVREALRAKTEKDQAVFMANANAAIQNRLNNIDRESYSGGLDEEAQKTVAGEIEAVRRTVQAGVESGAYTPEQGRRIIEAAEKQGVYGTIKGTFDRQPSLAAKQKFLTDMQEDYSKGGELTNIMSLEEFQRIEGDMLQDIQAGEAKLRAQAGEVARAAKDYADLAAKGFVPGEQDLATLEAAAEATGSPEAVAAVQSARARAELSHRYTRMSALELDFERRRIVEHMSQKGATAAGVETLEQIDRVKKAREEALSNDPYSWGARAGKIEPTPALTIGGGRDVFAQTLKQRRESRAILRQSYGTVPFFTGAEKEHMTEIARQGGAPALAVAQTLVETLGPDALDALAEISKDAPVLANVGGLLAKGGSPALAQDAFDAIAQRRVKDMPAVKFSDAIRTITARSVLGDAYLRSGATEASVRTTAELAAERRLRAMGREGDLSNDPEAIAVFEQTLDEAAGANWRNGVKHGGIDEVNGWKIVIPPTVPKGEVQRRLRRLTDVSGLPPMGTVNGLPVTAGQLRGAKLVSVGDGNYKAAFGDPRTPEPRYVQAPEGSSNPAPDGSTDWTVTIDDLRRASPDAEAPAFDLPLPGAPMMVPN